MTNLAALGMGTKANAKRKEIYPVARVAPWKAPNVHREWATVRQDVPGTLLYSDSPETVREPGLLYQGRVRGKGRLFFYHVNGMAEPMMLYIYALAKTDTTIAVRREMLPSPDLDFYQVGRTLSRADLTERINYRWISVVAHRPTLLNVKPYLVQQGYLAAGIIELEAADEVEIRVVMIPRARLARKYLAWWRGLARDGIHRRGTFDTYEREVHVAAYEPTQDGIVAMTFADGEVDAFLPGIDEITGGPVVHHGNYGLRYRIHIPQAMGSYRIYFNPQGGRYAGDIGVRVNYRESIVSLARKPEEPALGTGTLHDTVCIAEVPGGNEVELNWMPAGSSFLPIRLWLVPFGEEKTMM